MKKLTLAMLVVSAVTAFAVQAGEAQSRKVRFDDLNLGSMEGAKTLYSRITVAARGVCAPLRDYRDPLHQQPYEKCMKDSVGTAVASAHIATLTAVANGTSDTPIQMASR